MNDEPTPDRDARGAQREADKLRRDRERAADRERRDAEKAAAQRRRDEAQRERTAERERSQRERQETQREREQAQRERERQRQEAQRQREQAQRERERERQETQREREAQRAVDEAARAAAAASREAARIAAEAQRAERRAAQHGERAHSRARSLEAPEQPPDEGPRLPREIAILWRREPPARRGPRPGLTLDEIADAGIALADAEGIDAVSMARIAAELGYTAMSLYRYVASKDEVIALMVDRVIGTPPAVDPAAGWSERLGAVARAQLPVLFAHPWMTVTGSVVNTLGPHRLAWMEAFVAALDGTPLTPTEKLVVAGALGNQALADVRTSAEMAEFDRRAAQRGEASGFELLGQALVDPVAHPSLAAAFVAGALADEPARPTAAEASTGGIDLILEGVAAWIAGRS